MLQKWRVDRYQCSSQVRKHSQRSTQLCQVSRTGGAQGDPRKNALDVADTVQVATQLFEPASISECHESLVTGSQHCLVGQRPIEPSAQLARAHGGYAFVDQGKDGSVFFSGKTDIQLQVATGGGIDDQRIGALLDMDAANVGNRGFLCVTDVLQQGSRRADGQRQLVGAEPLQVEGAHLVGQEA